MKMKFHILIPVLAAMLAVPSHAAEAKKPAAKATKKACLSECKKKNDVGLEACKSKGAAEKAACKKEVRAAYKKCKEACPAK